MMGPKRRPGPASPVLQLAIDPAGEEPLYRQLYEGLRAAILSGRLPPGARLPSSRVFAADLGIARNTVLQAFNQLRSEGYLAGQRGGGTRVRSKIPDLLLEAGKRSNRTSRPKVAPDKVAEVGTSTAPAPRLSKRGKLLANSGTALASSGDRPVPFELGVAATDAFPERAWARIAARQWRRGAVVLGEADPAGERALRSAIASYLTAARAAHCTADQVLVVNGAQQAFHLIAQVLLDPGDALWIEDPGYMGARSAFEAAGARLVPVPVDGEGLNVAAGVGLASDARLAYVTPSHQFPLGVLMSAARRFELLAWARRNSAWIIEDDYDSEFRYSGRPLPCLQGLDIELSPAGSTGRVLYVGTFSKTLLPGLRMGYLVVPHDLVDVFRAVRAAMDRHTATLHQGIVADFIDEGHYTRQIREVRNLCAERQALLLDAAGELEGLLTIEPDPAGLHVVGWLPEGVDDRRAAAAAAAEGVRTTALSQCRIGKQPPSSRGALLLGYAAFDERQIREAVKRLRRALQAYSRSRATTAAHRSR